MSRSNPTEVKVGNPAKIFITYKPNDGKFLFYNKDTKTRAEGDSLEFIVTEGGKFSMTGYSSSYGAGYTSNYISKPKSEKFRIGVFTNGKYNEVENGFYQDIKGNIPDAKFTSSIFGLVKLGDNWVPAQLDLTGTARGTYFDMFVKGGVEKDVLIINASKDVYMLDTKTKDINVVPKDKQKKWMTTWFYQIEPVLRPITEDEDKLANEVSLEFDKFLKKDVEVVEEEPLSSTPAVQEPSGRSAVNELPTTSLDYDDLPF